MLASLPAGCGAAHMNDTNLPRRDVGSRQTPSSTSPPFAMTMAATPSSHVRNEVADTARAFLLNAAVGNFAAVCRLIAPAVLGGFQRALVARYLHVRASGCLETELKLFRRLDSRTRQFLLTLGGRGVWMFVGYDGHWATGSLTFKVLGQGLTLEQVSGRWMMAQAPPYGNLPPDTYY